MLSALFNTEYPKINNLLKAFKAEHKTDDGRLSYNGNTDTVDGDVYLVMAFIGYLYDLDECTLISVETL